MASNYLQTSTRRHTPAKELDEVAKGSAATSTLRDCDWWFSTLFGNISQGGRHVHHIVPRYIQKYLRELPNGQLRPGWSLNENLSPGAVLERAEHLNDLHNGQNGMRTVLPSGSNQLNGRSANDVAQTLVNFYIDTGRKGMARAAQDFFAQRNIATDPIP